MYHIIILLWGQNVLTIIKRSVIFSHARTRVNVFFLFKQKFKVNKQIKGHKIFLCITEVRVRVKYKHSVMVCYVQLH